MGCRIELQNAVDSTIRKLKSAMSLMGDTTTASGENLRLTIERLEKVKTLGSSEAVVMLGDMANRDVYNVAARAQIGDKVKVAIRRSVKSKFGEFREANLVKATMHGSTSKLVLEMDGKYSTYEFNNRETSDVTSLDSLVMINDGTAAGINKAALLVEKLNTEIGREEARNMLISAFDGVRDSISPDLGAFDEDVLIDLAKRTKVGSAVGTTETMKDNLTMLHAMGVNKASPEYLDHAEGLLDAMHPRFFTDMSLYVDQGQGDAAGWVSVEKKAIIVDISTDANSRMTDAEVYMHELIHAMTHWAWNQDSLYASRLKRQVQHVIKTAKSKTKWKDFLAVDENVATSVDIDRAKALYDYVFTSKYSEEEFLTHVLTNPVVMKHMKTVMVKGDEQADVTLLQKAVTMFKNLMNAVLGNYDFSDRNKDAYQQIHSLVFKLAEINGSASNKISKSWLGKADDLINSIDDRISREIERASEKLVKAGVGGIPPYPADKSKLVQALYSIRFLAKAAVHPATRSTLGAQFFTKVLDMTPETSLREAFNTLLEESDVKKTANWLGLQNTKIDTLRNSVINQNVSDIKNGFSRPLTEAQESAITEVITDTNASAMIKAGMSLDRFKEILDDKAELDKEYKAVEASIRSKITDKNLANWALNQADALGYFMATHLGNEASVLNARTIAAQVNRSDLVPELEKMSSLFAIRHSSEEAKVQLSIVISQEKEGLGLVVDAYEAFKEDSRRVLFKGDDNHMIDGYSKEVFDDTMDFKVVPLKDRQKMEDAGYTFKKEVVTPVDSNNKYGLFVTETFSKAERLRGAVNLGETQSRGTSIKEMVYREVPWDVATNESDTKALKSIAASKVEKALLNLQDSGNRLQEAMSSKRLDMTQYANGIVPVLDASNKIVDYRSMMSKADKKELLKQNTAISDVLGRSMGSIIDKSRREAHNLEVLEVLKKNIEEDWDGSEFSLNKGITTEYRLIGPNSPDPKLKELYYMLPDSFKNYIESRDDKTLAVPAELMNILFGYKHLKFSNLKGVNLLPRSIKHVLDMFETYFIDLIKIVKTTILLKMPIILISNIVSNIVYAFNAGMNPLEIVKMYKESFADVKQFMNDNRQKIKLEQELSRVKQESVRLRKDYKEKIKEIEDELIIIDKRMNTNQVKELFDLGMYQSVVEDVETSRLNDTNKVSEGLDKAMNRLPGVVKTPLQWLYLSKETKWYQINQEVLQMSDLIARDVMNRKQKMIEQETANGERDLPREFRKFMFEEKGVVYPVRDKLVGNLRDEYLKYAKQSREYNLLKTFVNYNQPNGRLEEYLNRVGLLMFTKYVKNIQRVILQTGSKHPLRTTLTVLLSGGLLNVDYIQEQAFAIKGFGFDGEFGVTNIFPVYNPIENVLDLINPPLIQLATSPF